MARNITHYAYRYVALYAGLIGDVTGSTWLCVTCSDVIRDVTQLVGRRQ